MIPETAPANIAGDRTELGSSGKGSAARTMSTGVGGAAYEKKTDQAMCEELKDVDYMFALVEEAAGTSACDVESLVGCGDKQREYIGKWKDGKSLADYLAQSSDDDDDSSDDIVDSFAALAAAEEDDEDSDGESGDAAIC